MSSTCKPVTSWSFRLASRRSTSSSESSNDEPREELSATDLAQELDLSTRDESTVAFRKDPWSVAKLNAAMKRKPEGDGDVRVAQGGKTDGDETERGGPIERAFRKQAMSSKPALARPQPKPFRSAQSRNPLSSSDAPGPFFVQAQKSKPSLLTSKASSKASQSVSSVPSVNDTPLNRPTTQLVSWPASSGSVAMPDVYVSSPEFSVETALPRSPYGTLPLPRWSPPPAVSPIMAAPMSQNRSVYDSPIMGTRSLSSSGSVQQSHPPPTMSCALSSVNQLDDSSSTMYNPHLFPSSSPVSAWAYSTPVSSGLSQPASLSAIPSSSAPAVVLTDYPAVSSESFFPFRSIEPHSSSSVSRVRHLLHNAVNLPSTIAFPDCQPYETEIPAQCESFPQYQQYSSPATSSLLSSAVHPAASRHVSPYARSTKPTAPARPATLSPATKRAISQAARPASSRASQASPPRRRAKINRPSPSPSPPPTKRARAVIPSSHPDLAAPEIWSTLPAKKRKGPAKVIQSGRFSLPHLIPKGEGVIIKKEEPKSVGIGFKPPPRDAKLEGPSHSGSAGWKLTLLGSTHELGSSSKSAKSTSASNSSVLPRSMRRFSDAGAARNQQKPVRGPRQQKLQDLYDAFEDSDDEDPDKRKDPDPQPAQDLHMNSEDTAVESDKSHCATSETLYDDDVPMAYGDVEDPPVDPVDDTVPSSDVLRVGLARLSQTYPLTREAISVRI